MLATQSTTFDVNTGLTTILTIRETNSYQRTLYFRNLTTDALAVQVECSMDGGTTWSVVGTSFTLASLVSQVFGVPAINSGILRVRASGGGNDRDLEIAYARLFDDLGHIWQTPVA